MRGALGDLRVRHLAYGVRRDHCGTAEDALIAMLRERLGPGLAAAAAWRRLLGALSETMIEAAYPPAKVVGDLD